jgi:hypothetical protein
MYGTTTVINSTLTGNTAQGGNGFGGINGTGGAGYGGALFNLDGVMDLTYATVAENTANGGSGSFNIGFPDGGAVYNLAFGNDPVTGNPQTATLTLTNGILAQSNSTVGFTINDLISNATNGLGVNTAQVLGSANLVQNSFAFVGNGSTFLAPGVITVTANPNLGSLAINPGPVAIPTLALPPGSSAIGAADLTVPNLPTIDERGLARPTTMADLGAFQTQYTALQVANASGNFGSTSSQMVTLSATVTFNGQPPSPAVGSVTFTVDSLPSVSAPIDNSGVATTTLTLPPDFPAGNTTISATYTDSTNQFGSSTATGTLTVNPAATQTSVGTATATFTNAGTQSVTVMATVTSPTGGSVNEGNVAFTLGNLMATGMVDSQGNASATLTLPAGFAVGTYTVDAAYTDTNNTNGTVNFLASDGSGSLIVNPAATQVSVGAAAATFTNAGTQDVMVTASVTSPTGGTVNEGQVAFTLGSLMATGMVDSQGNASATLTLPAGFAAGTYTVNAAYTDTSNPANFAGSTGSGSLVVGPAATSTTITTPAVSVTFNGDTAQQVSVSAAVTSPTGGTVNEGSVVFTLGSLTATGMVDSQGNASATLTVPAGFAAGSYTVNASYADTPNTNSAVNFAPSTAGSPLQVTVLPADTAVAVANATTSYNSGPHSVTLTADVTSPNGGTVNEGQVTFTVGSLTATGPVSGGVGTATLALPAGFLAGTYSVGASYTDGGAGGQGNFKASTAASPGTLMVTTAPTQTTTGSLTTAFNSDHTQTITLTATITSLTGGTVNEGSVSLSVGSLPAVMGSVNSQGMATASLTVPAGFPAGVYGVHGEYTDAANANGVPNFGPSSTGQLTVTVGSTETAVANASVPFSSAGSVVNVTAAVTSPNGTVREGNVTFTVGSLRAIVPVNNGVATGPLALPPGFPVGTYSLQASYADVTSGGQSGSFLSSTASPATLTVTAGPTTIALSSASSTPGNGQVLQTVTAAVTGPSGPVNSGVVTFTIAGQTVQAAVHNGSATASVPVGLFTAGNPVHVEATYSDGAGGFSSSQTGGHLACWTFLDSFFPGMVAYLVDGGQMVTTEVFGLPMVFIYNSKGRILSVTWGPFTLWQAP